MVLFNVGDGVIMVKVAHRVVNLFKFQLVLITIVALTLLVLFTVGDGMGMVK